jgi:hypothetical protein
VPEPSPGPSPGPSPRTPSVTAVVRSSRLAVTPSGTTSVVLSCSGPRGLRCRGILDLVTGPFRLAHPARAIILGRAPFSLPTGGREAVPVSLRAIARRALAEPCGPRRATVRLAVRQPAGRTTRPRRRVLVLADRCIEGRG